MARKLPVVQPGQPILAEHILAIYEALQEIDLKVVPPLVLGPLNTIYLASKPGFWIKLTGAPSSIAHPWQEVIPAASGTWSVGSLSGTTSTDPAYEINGSTATLTNKYARAWRDLATGEVRFNYSTC